MKSDDYGEYLFREGARRFREHLEDTQALGGLLKKNYMSGMQGTTVDVRMPKVIPVPDLEGPTAVLCWKQAENMVRCDRTKDHKGRHSWEKEQ